MRSKDKDVILALQTGYIFEAKFLSWFIKNQKSEEANILLNKLSQEMFSDVTTKEIFKFAQFFANQAPIDYDVFVEYINKIKFNTIVDFDLIYNIFNDKLIQDGVDFIAEDYFQYIKAEYAKRVIAEKAMMIHNAAANTSKNAKDLVSEMNALQDEISEHLDNEEDFELLSMGEEHQRYKQEIEDDYNRSLNGDLKTKTLIGDFDRLTGGFTNGDLIIIGARPSMGKTSLAISMLYGMLNSKPDGVFVFFSAEVNPKKIKAKLTAIHANLSARVLTDFDGYGENRDIVDEAIDVVHTEVAKDRLYIINTNNKTIGYIKKVLIKIYKKHGRIDGAFLDYLQILKLENKRDKHLEIGEISRDLKRFAMQWDFPFIALAQLNRNLEQRDDKRPVPADLKDSGDIEQDADLIVFIYRDDVYQNKKKKDEAYQEEVVQAKISMAELIVAKHRNGPTGTVWSSFNKLTTRFGTATLEDELDFLKNESLNINEEKTQKPVSKVIQQNNEQVIVIGQPIKRDLTNPTTLFDTSMAGGGLTPFPQENDDFILLKTSEN